MSYESLSPEQQERAKACKSPEELAALAEKEGFELTDEQLDGIAGGFIECPKDYCCPSYLHEQGPVIL